MMIFPNPRKASSEVILQVATKPIYYGGSGNVFDLLMENQNEKVAALQVDIRYSMECFRVTDVAKTYRSETMQIFNYAPIDGGIRLAITGINNYMDIGSGPIAEIIFDTAIDCCNLYERWDIVDCTAVDSSGSHLTCSEINADVDYVGCIVEFSTSHLDFGDVQIYRSVKTVLEIRNCGNVQGDMSITSSGRFSASISQFILPPGVIQTLTVTCTPTDTGICNGTLIISGCDDEHTIQVSCRGVRCKNRGDIVLDGKINILDVLEVVNEILGIKLPPGMDCRADCNDDGVINIQDALALVNIILGSGTTCEP
jgi:hypothetical protein